MTKGYRRRPDLLSRLLELFRTLTSVHYPSVSALQSRRYQLESGVDMSNSYDESTDALALVTFQVAVLSGHDGHIT